MADGTLHSMWVGTVSGSLEPGFSLGLLSGSRLLGGPPFPGMEMGEAEPSTCVERQGKVSGADLTSVILNVLMKVFEFDMLLQVLLWLVLIYIQICSMMINKQISLVLVLIC